MNTSSYLAGGALALALVVSLEQQAHERAVEPEASVSSAASTRLIEAPEATYSEQNTSDKVVVNPHQHHLETQAMAAAATVSTS